MVNIQIREEREKEKEKEIKERRYFNSTSDLCRSRQKKLFPPLPPAPSPPPHALLPHRKPSPTSFISQGIRVSPLVAAALRSRSPVVALESTIVAHGMPYPRNVRVALAVEAAVRAAGATPATIGVIAGVPTVGLTEEEIERLGRGGPEGSVRKLSRRDIAACVASRCDGATTVSGTMLLAAAAGIKVFVTGGLGGVHRGASESFDISADLPELARSPVAVVCAFAKSVLDLPKTAQLLETAGVPVVGYRTSELPAFFSASSGLVAPCRASDAEEAAAIVAAHLRMRLGGLVIAVPPPEVEGVDMREIDRAIEGALARAKQAEEEEAKRTGGQGKGTGGSSSVSGAKATPFLLEAIREATSGKSLEINVALVLNNAAVGAAVAVALAGGRRSN